MSNEGLVDRGQFGGIMKIEKVWCSFFIVACLGMLGCDCQDGEPQRSPGSSQSVVMAPRQESTPIAVVVGETAPTEVHASKQVVERILAMDMGTIPIHARYHALTTMANDMWDNLGSKMTNDVEYVLCAAARLQVLVDKELKTVHVSTNSVNRGPVRHGIDGTPYHVMPVELAKKASSEEARIRATQDYLRQLKHFSEHYPNRIDSLGYLFNGLGDGQKKQVLGEVTEILGRRPSWQVHDSATVPR